MSVYLPAQYADPTTHYPIYEKLMDYQQAHPNIELTFVSPASSDLAEREAVISQLSAEITLDELIGILSSKMRLYLDE